MLVIKVGRRGQITLPRHIRRQFGLQEGDSLAVTTEAGQLVLLPLRQTLLDLRGSIPVSGEQDFPAIREEAIVYRVKKVVEDEQ